MTITTEEEYQSALKRRDSLSGFEEDTAEKQLLVDLQQAIDVWEAKHPMMA